MKNRPLYVIMRSDLPSLNPGKKMAQACHAANQFVKSVNDADFVDNVRLIKSFAQWESQTNYGFGTTIVLDGTSIDFMRNQLGRLNPMNWMWDMVIDPSYPILDGDTIHLVPDVITCAYAFPFGDSKSDMEAFNLHP